MRRPAFTLLELLIVIAVIALLIGLLLPALGRARVSARAVECASNARQLQLANELYASDHAERYMPGAAAIQTTNLRRWHGVRERSGLPFTGGGAPVTAYLDGEGAARAVRACPEFAGVLDELASTGAGFERGCGGYGYNQAFVGAERYEIMPGVWEVRTDLLGSRRDRFAQPTATVAFADAAFIGQGGRVIEYSFVEPRRWPQWPSFRPDPSAHFRHAGRCTVVWLDGHATGEARASVEFSAFTPGDFDGLGIGWFGSGDDNSQFDYR